MKRPPAHYYEFGPFRLDVVERQLFRDGNVVPLTVKAVDTLLTLVRNGPHLVEKDALMQEIWPDAFVEEANLAFNISVIRRTLGDRAHESTFIETVPKRGYRFVAPIREVHERHDVKSLAVLPFLNLSLQQENEDHFADGITDALISELSQIASLRVISRTSVMQYKSHPKPLPVVARKLQLDFAVEGSVLYGNGHVRITVQLIDALNDTHLWSANFERDFRDVFSLLGEVVRSIAQEIEIKLTPGEKSRIARVRPIAPEVHAAYLRGRYYWHQSFTEEGLRRAATHFQHAINAEPLYAQAWSGLSDCYNAMAVNAMLPADEGWPKGKQAASRALELDPLLADAHASMAAVHLFWEWDWPATERALKRATELSPSSSSAQSLYTHYFLARGWQEQAVVSARLALHLDPLSAVHNADLAWAYTLGREYERAIAQYRTTLETGLHFPWARVGLGLAYLHAGKPDEAITEIRKALSPSQEWRGPALAALGYSLGIAGKEPDARKVMEEMNELSKQSAVTPYDRAVICLGLGERNEAILWLERAYETRATYVIWIKLDPIFDSIRSDKRFEDLVCRLKLD